MSDEEWTDLGDAAQLARQSLQQLNVGRTRLAVCFVDGTFSVISVITPSVP